MCSGADPALPAAARRRAPMGKSLAHDQVTDYQLKVAAKRGIFLGAPAGQHGIHHGNIISEMGNACSRNFHVETCPNVQFLRVVWSWPICPVA